MAASEALQRVIRMLQERAAEKYSSVEEDRLGYEVMMSQFKLKEDIICERVAAGGVSAEWITAPGAADDRVMLYLHGGGYTRGSVRTHRECLSRLSRSSRARVLGLDYRLVPEHPFPAQLEDTIAAYRWLLANGGDPAKIVIGGDSSGGGLTVSACVALRYLGEPLPAAGICLSPWTDLESIGESYTTNAEVDPLVKRERLQDMARAFLAGRDPRTPLAAPLYADLRGLPPLLIMAGSIELMLDDATRLAQQAKEAGVDVTLEVWEDMPHNWQLFASVLPEGQQSIERIGEFIGKHTSSG